MSFDTLPDNVVNDALKKLDKQFEERDLIDPGEMLHMFSLKMMIAEEKIQDTKIESVEEECKIYIDDVLKAGRLPPASPNDPSNDLLSSHDGLGFWVSETSAECFGRVRQHLINAQKNALSLQFPSIGALLLEDVRSNGRKFFDQVCRSESGSGLYARVPVLAHIEPKEFLTAWLGSQNDNWRVISLALASRYDSGALERELADERPWILKLLELLDQTAAQARGFRALRMRRVVHPKLAALRVKPENG